MNFLIKTFGCKVNQYESQAIRESLEKAGARELCGKSRFADLVIVNTCTVTRSADRTTLYWIRRLKREHPGCRLAVTGCFAERDSELLETMPEVDAVFTNQQKDSIAATLVAGKRSFGCAGASARKEYLPLSITRSEGKTRAHVKIQDGCNHSCSYCKVVLVRGPSRSRPLPEILNEVRRLADSGYKEIVLTGIQLGAYGDFPSKRPEALVRVIEGCSGIPGVERIRLSSIEPTDIHEPLIRAFRDFPKLCPQLHIPLQSGDDAILKGMNRRYTAAFYTDLIARLREAIPDFCLTLDVMTGFPGEGERQFENTLETLARVRPLKSHVFPYSPREGTRAALLADLPAGVVQERAKRLITWTNGLSKEVRRSFLGRMVPVLAEHKHPRRKFREGRAPNYLRVFFEFHRDVQGCIISVVLTELHEDGCLGKITARRDHGFCVESD